MFLIWHLEGKAESFDFFINDFEMWCLQLPSTQLENVLTKHTNLRTPLASYVINKNIHPTLPRSVVLAVFLNVFSFNDLWSFLLCLKLLFTHKNGGMFEFLVPYKKKMNFWASLGYLFLLLWHCLSSYSQTLKVLGLLNESEQTTTRPFDSGASIQGATLTWSILARNDDIPFGPNRRGVIVVLLDWRRN